MDSENIRLEFVNGSTITVIYEPYPAFRHIDTRTPFDEPNTTRGYQATGLFYDEFVDEDWMDEFDSYYTTHDFGEISQSQELNDFVNTLIQGE